VSGPTGANTRRHGSRARSRRRNEASCVDCGSRERLEFDHIIPVGKHGSNTARNIELRCEICNGRKGARV
jgi:5-methylcytosine-specific restriction endonuclease McrA